MRKLEAPPPSRKSISILQLPVWDAGYKEQDFHGIPTVYIQKAIQYIEQRLLAAHHHPQIAGFVGVSSIYLTKLFKLSTGKTLSEYLNYYRTQKSLDLLMNTEETIGWISEAVGYSDVRSYIRFFKNFTI